MRLGHVSNLDVSNMKLMTVDQKALELLGSIKPRALLLVLLGTLLGGLVGVLVVLHRVEPL